jgi:uncharacterized membrane protein
LPTYLGWEHHVKQRGLEPIDVIKRSLVIKKIYESSDAEEAYRMLRANHITLVMVGSLERVTYNRTGLEKFDQSPHFKRLVHFGRESLYKVLPEQSPPRATAAVAPGAE